MVRLPITFFLLVIFGFCWAEGAGEPVMDSAQMSRVDFYGLNERDSANVGATEIPLAPRDTPSARRSIKIPRRLAESDWEDTSPADSVEHYRTLRDRFKRSGSRRSGTGTVFLTVGAALMVTGGLIAYQGYRSHREWERYCDDDADRPANYSCYSQENQVDLQVFFAEVSLIAGAAFVGGGIGFKAMGSSRLRRADQYQERLRYWEEMDRKHSALSGGPLSEAQWRWLPIVDPLRGRGGMELALGF